MQDTDNIDANAVAEARNSKADANMQVQNGKIEFRRRHAYIKEVKYYI